MGWRYTDIDIKWKPLLRLKWHICVLFITIYTLITHCISRKWLTLCVGVLWKSRCVYFCMWWVKSFLVIYFRGTVCNILTWLLTCWCVPVHVNHSCIIISSLLGPFFQDAFLISIMSDIARFFFNISLKIVYKVYMFGAHLVSFGVCVCVCLCAPPLLGTNGQKAWHHFVNVCTNGTREKQKYILYRYEIMRWKSVFLSVTYFNITLEKAQERGAKGRFSDVWEEWLGPNNCTITKQVHQLGWKNVQKEKTCRVFPECLLVSHNSWYWSLFFI